MTGYGLGSSRRFWETCVEPIVDGVVGPGVAGACLLGRGSEVLGFDDERSADHDFGPRVQVVVPAHLVEDVAALDDALSSALPASFEGREVRFPTTYDPAVRHQVEVTTVAELFASHLGLDPTHGIPPHAWLAWPTQVLRSLTEGAVFADPDGGLTAGRNALRWYPDDVWRYVLACQWRRLWQEEGLLGRAAERGDTIGERLIAATLARDLVRLAFLLERAYAPYDKWLGTAFAQLRIADDIDSPLTALLGTDEVSARQHAYNTVASTCAKRFNELALVDDIDPSPRQFHDRPWLVLGADRYAEACLRSTSLAGRGWRGSIDQWSDNTDLLRVQSAWSVDAGGDEGADRLGSDEAIED